VKRLTIAALLALAAGPALASDTPCLGSVFKEAKPFGHPQRDVAAALAHAQRDGHQVILVFGANWCHDSRALAGWFATPKFREMLGSRYDVVWVDIGKKDRNLDLARRFGLDGIAGTPTVLIVDAAGNPLNLADAPTWHNAASRPEAAIYDYFAKR